jgi:hypothetical protein
LWSGEIAAGDLFTIVGDNAWYEVASVGSNTSITLSANYAGTTGSGKSYAISRDFTTRLALPYPQKGDIETASIIKRAFEQIDTETNIATANYSATSAPTANDDSGDGYSIGSWWVNVTSDEAYLCVDSTVGAAVWTKISVDVPSEIVALLAGQSVSMASLTLSGGTANGVLYLNGSKVATSGSALWFDGSNLGVGNNLATTVDNNNGSGKLVVGTGSGSQGMTIYSGSSSGNEARITFANSSTGSGSYAAQISYKSGDAAVLIYNNNAERYRINSDGTAIWSVAGSEAMRLTGTGLGVGTSSPGAKLDVRVSGATTTLDGLNVSNGTAAGIFKVTGATYSYRGVGSNVLWMGGDSTSMYVGTSTAQPVLFGTAAYEQMRLDTSGNLGLGVTPAAWSPSGAGGPILQIQNGAFFGSTSTTGVLNNAYYNGGFKYISSDYASWYEQIDSKHAWYTAPSGTAGDAITFTQAMSLTADGDWLLKTTSKYSSAIATISGGLNGVNQSLALVQTDNTAFHDKIQFANTGGVVGTISTTGSATAYNTSSDYRLKNITGPITKSGAYIDSLNPVEGTWKADGSTFVGLIAHEVQETSRTNVATGVKDGEEMQSMDYSSAEIIANLIAEVKSLRQRVATLEAK